MKTFIIGYDLQKDRLVEYESTKEASLNSEDWLSIPAFDIGTAKKNYEEIFQGWKDARDSGMDCTDGSSQQYGKHLHDRVYRFKEWDRFNCDGWIEDTIDLDRVSQQKIEESVSPYYESMEKLEQATNKDHPHSMDWIIAECIFEQESGLY